MGICSIKGLTVLLCLMPIENSIPRSVEVVNQLVVLKPRVARMMMSPVCPARRTRASSSSMKRATPRWVFALPFAVADMQDLAGVGSGPRATGDSRACGCTRSRRPASDRRRPRR